MRSVSVIGAVFVFLLGVFLGNNMFGLGGGVLFGGLLVLLYAFRMVTRKPGAIAINSYGTDSLRNLVAAFQRDHGREPTTGEAEGLAKLAAYMQYSHEHPSTGTDYSAMTSLFSGIYGRRPSILEDATFARMVASAYPKQVATPSRDPEIAAAEQGSGAAHEALGNAEAAVANDPTA